MFRYDRMNALAHEKGIKKAHICRELGKPVYYLRDTERNGTDINGESLKIIADILGTTPEYLSGNSEEKEIPALENESGAGTLTGEEARFLNAARRMRPDQRAFLLELVEAAVRNTPPEVPQVPARLSVALPEAAGTPLAGNNHP